jgi:hypothetical protein
VDLFYLDQNNLKAWSCEDVDAVSSPSFFFPALGLLRPVMDVTKLNPSIFSKVCLNLFSVNAIYVP